MELIEKRDAMDCCFKPQVRPNEEIFNALKMAIRSEISALKSVDAVLIEPLSEWLAGYCAPPKYAIDAVGGLREMADATKRAKAWEFALTSMERSGFLEVRVE